MTTFRPSTAPRWKIATTTFFPFVVAAFAMRTKTFGRRAPLTSARPEDLRKILRFMGSPVVRVAGVLGCWVAGLLGNPAPRNPATRYSLPLKLRTAQYQSDNHGWLGLLAGLRCDGGLRLGG